MIKIGMLNDKIPLCIIHFVIEICDCDLHPPVLFVVLLDMPVDSDWTHVASAVNNRCITIDLARNGKS